MADLADVAGEARPQVDGRRIEPHEDGDLARHWVDLDAREVPEPLERDVRLERLHLHVVAESLVPNQADVAADLLHGVLVVFREVPGDTEQSWRRPVDAGRHLCPRL